MSDSNTLEVGDVVVLKSGGPKMTVEAFTSAQSVLCVWFHLSSICVSPDPDDRSEIHLYDDARHASFPSATLQKAV